MPHSVSLSRVVTLGGFLGSLCGSMYHEFTGNQTSKVLGVAQWQSTCLAHMSVNTEIHVIFLECKCSKLGLNLDSKIKEWLGISAASL